MEVLAPPTSESARATKTWESIAAIFFACDPKFKPKHQMKQIWHKSQVHDSVKYRFLWREGELVALDSTKEAIYNEVVGEKATEILQGRKSHRERKR